MWAAASISCLSHAQHHPLFCARPVEGSPPRSRSWSRPHDAEGAASTAASSQEPDCTQQPGLRLVLVAGMDFYVVMDRAGYRVAKRRKCTQHVGPQHKVTKDDCIKWCVRGRTPPSPFAALRGASAWPCQAVQAVPQLQEVALRGLARGRDVRGMEGQGVVELAAMSC